MVDFRLSPGFSSVDCLAFIGRVFPAFPMLPLGCSFLVYWFRGRFFLRSGRIPVLGVVVFRVVFLGSRWSVVPCPVRLRLRRWFFLWLFRM
jgi:hypothetical protein